MGGRGTKGTAGNKSSVRNTMPAISASQAERMVRDTPGFGNKSRITSVTILRENKDDTVDLKFTFNTTPGPGRWYSEDKSVVIKRVIANSDR